MNIFHIGALPDIGVCGTKVKSFLEEIYSLKFFGMNIPWRRRLLSARSANNIPLKQKRDYFMTGQFTRYGYSPGFGGAGTISMISCAQDGHLYATALSWLNCEHREDQHDIGGARVEALWCSMGAQ